MGFLDIASEKLNGLQQYTTDFLNVQKLNSKLRATRRQLERIHTAIGETCCRIHDGNGDASVLEPMFEKAAEIRAEINELMRAIDKLNRVVRCPKCGNAVSQQLRYCTQCGTQLNSEYNEQY